MRVTIWVYWCYFSGGEDKTNDLGVGHQLQYESDTADILLLFKVAQNSNRKQNHIEDSSSNCNYNNPRNKNRVGSQLRTADFASISHGFFPPKKWMISPKKNGGETPAATPAPSCWGHVSSKPFLLGGLGKANWTRRGHGPFMEPPWLVKLVWNLQPPKNSGDLTVCELENGVLDCKTWWLRPIKTGVFHSYIKLPKGISTLDMIDIPPTYARLAGYRNPSFAQEISSMS